MLPRALLVGWVVFHGSAALAAGDEGAEQGMAEVAATQPASELAPSPGAARQGTGDGPVNAAKVAARWYAGLFGGVQGAQCLHLVIPLLVAGVATLVAPVAAAVLAGPYFVAAAVTWYAAQGAGLMGLLLYVIAIAVAAMGIMFTVAVGMAWAAVLAVVGAAWWAVTALGGVVDAGIAVAAPVMARAVPLPRSGVEVPAPPYLAPTILAGLAPLGLAWGVVAVALSIASGLVLGGAGAYYAVNVLSPPRDANVVMAADVVIVAAMAAGVLVAVLAAPLPLAGSLVARVAQTAVGSRLASVHATTGEPVAQGGTDPRTP
jgi:hypothetical protein